MVGGIKGDPIRPCHRASGQMAGAESNHPLFTGACQQVEMHHPRCAGHRSLAAEFGGSRWREAKTLAPGHGGKGAEVSSLTAADLRPPSSRRTWGSLR